MKKKYESPSFVILKDGVDFWAHFGFRKGSLMIKCVQMIAIDSLD